MSYLCIVIHERVTQQSFINFNNLTLMIQVVLYQNTNKLIEGAFQKWYPKIVNTETIGLDEVAEHMASHNTPFSKGAIMGILTDFVSCTKELLLLGKNIKIPDLAIFSLGLLVKGGASTKEEWTVTKYIEGLRLRARGTGELTSANLDTTIRKIDLAESSSSSDADADSDAGSGSGSSSGSTGEEGGDESGKL